MQFSVRYVDTLGSSRRGLVLRGQAAFRRIFRQSLLGRDFSPTDLEVALCARGIVLVDAAGFSSWKDNSWYSGNFLTLWVGQIDVYVNLNL